jgi:hypothetical protein
MLVSILHLIGYVLHFLQYALALRISLLAVSFLIGFPLFAFRGGRALFYGMFDLTWLSLMAVTLSTWALAATAVRAARLVLRYGEVRFGLPRLPANGFIHDLVYNDDLKTRLVWLGVILVLTLWVLGHAIYLSRRQGLVVAKRILQGVVGVKQKQATWQLVLSVLAGLTLAAFVTWLVMEAGTKFASEWAQKTLTWPVVERSLKLAHVVDPGARAQWQDHLFTLIVFLATFACWLLLGIYGYFALGKPKTVPALASLIQLVLMATWGFSAATFWLDYWRIPVLFVVAVLGILSALAPWGDHTYEVQETTLRAGALPGELIDITANGDVIVAAAMGGGIQAAAWTALVLKQLSQIEGFVPSLRMVSSVSGGSMGAACFVNSLLDTTGAAADPVEAASASSLDEVAWALAWPDFLRTTAPFFFGWMIDRGRALEMAWTRNSATDPKRMQQLTGLLGSWNQQALAGNAPSVVMNSTIVESGCRLLLGTSELAKGMGSDGRESARTLHRLGNVQYDVAAVTAARLSATFPWVTPTARTDKDPKKPHMVDGGYYDDYGMATLVEWVDEALGTCKIPIKRVLVLPIHCVKAGGTAMAQGDRSNRGWVFQLVAPLLAVLGVRSAAQLANNDIGFDLLKKKWSCRGVDVQSVLFTFPGEHPPLSWHLTEEDQQSLRDGWLCPKVQTSVHAVRKFLS